MHRVPAAVVRNTRNVVEREQTLDTEEKSVVQEGPETGMKERGDFSQRRRECRGRGVVSCENTTIRKYTFLYRCFYASITPE